MTTAFVNYLGEPVSFSAAPAKKQTRPQPDSFHKGWRVIGIPPGALEEAQKTHAADELVARKAGKPIKEWDAENWTANAKKVPVRSKPYEIQEAAMDCKALAERSGWLAVAVVEIKRD